MNFSNEDYAAMADMLISYHMHSFRIRREEIFDIEFTPPIVYELDNARKRLGNRYIQSEKVQQVYGLHEIISRTKDEVSTLATKAKESENPQEQYTKAEELMEQLGGASYLLELL